MADHVEYSGSGYKLGAAGEVGRGAVFVLGFAMLLTQQRTRIVYDTAGISLACCALDKSNPKVQYDALRHVIQRPMPVLP